ncbi:fungal-specific transcription factor domain-containing protein [Aspergillus pseudoustus]|uniref:Fungal-specific transcription factor domain-containing protein n=1 Tax=Aspergillus pseudoustus TaxID=1810923 RepID=A0ABR4L206_9EURO
MEIPGVVPPGERAALSPGQNRRRGIGRTACSRCKARKQRCDGRLPECSSCEKSGHACDLQNIRSDDVVVAKYIQSLENRIAELESDSPPSRSQPHQPDSNPTFPLPGRISIGDVVNSLCWDLPGTASISESSQFGLHPALNLGDVARTHPSPGNSNTEHESPGRAGNCSYTASTENRTESASPPTDELGAKLIDAYVERLDWRYPFLDLEDIRTLHRDRDSHSSSQPGLFKLYLVYAIGSGLLDLTEKRTSSPMPEAFYATAMQHVPSTRDPRSLENIEGMVLLALFHLRSIISQELWYLIGFAMRTCIHLGMYLSRREAGLPASIIQRRRKLFWTVYSLERNISIALGYPVSLPDRLIDVDLPTVSGGEDERLQQAILIFQLRRIESRIHNSIYRNDRSLPELLPKTSWHYSQLQEWKVRIEVSMGNRLDGGSRRFDYLLLHYHRAIRLLVQPFLSILPTSDPYYTACLESAGQICQLHKRLHQNSDYGHSFIAVQTVFVSGIMLLYCLWTHGNDVWSIRLSNNLRACSSVLFVMGERTAWVRRYRDAFEALVTVTMDRLEGQQEARSASASAGDIHMQGTEIASTENPNNVPLPGQFAPGMAECAPGAPEVMPIPMPPPLQVLQDRWMEFDTMALVNELVTWADPISSGQTPYVPDYGSFEGWDAWQLP